ncbi:MAG: VOC family protein [Sphingomonas sp.]|uniref:VOC family protein n=1 Tax=Sphingomonas sp. TaxID=28214 RepID=UPI001841CCF6|nr:VOC family protein [Sphingomonas sp.]MBA3667481.1 VOC family protein [Sphingomonas sp.]
MQIRHVVIKVDDQEKALAFYTEVLGFEKVHDLPGGIRWLTVRAPEGAEGVELVLEPNYMAPALASQKALYEAGFPATIFTTDDLAGDFRSLKERGVRFTGEPKRMGSVTFAFFDDTCGNLIVLSQRDEDAA